MLMKLRLVCIKRTARLRIWTAMDGAAILGRSSLTHSHVTDLSSSWTIHASAVIVIVVTVAEYAVVSAVTVGVVIIHILRMIRSLQW